MNWRKVVLIGLWLANPASAGADMAHPFLPAEITQIIDRTRVVRAYRLQLPRPGHLAGDYLGGLVISEKRPKLDAEQQGFVKWATLSDRTHDDVLKGIQLACALPKMGLRFVSPEDSVDVTFAPSCLDQWSFSLSRGSDLDHLVATSSSFAVIRPEMLTLLRELFPGEAELEKGKGATYRSNWPLQLPGAARNGR